MKGEITYNTVPRPKPKKWIFFKKGTESQKVEQLKGLGNRSISCHVPSVVKVLECHQAVLAE